MIWVDILVQVCRFQHLGGTCCFRGIDFMIWDELWSEIEISGVSFSGFGSKIEDLGCSSQHSRWNCNFKCLELRISVEASVWGCLF